MFIPCALQIINYNFDIITECYERNIYFLNKIIIFFKILTRSKCSSENIHRVNFQLYFFHNYVHNYRFLGFIYGRKLTAPERVFTRIRQWDFALAIIDPKYRRNEETGTGKAISR